MACAASYDVTAAFILNSQHGHSVLSMPSCHAKPTMLPKHLDSALGLLYIVFSIHVKLSVSVKQNGLN